MTNSVFLSLQTTVLGSTNDCLTCNRLILIPNVVSLKKKFNISLPGSTSKNI